MYSKKTNTIFTVGIIAVIVILLLLTINMEKLSVDENGSETTTISEGNESGTKSADDMLREEATKYMQEAMEVDNVRYRGKYKDRKDSFEVNEDFITEDYLFKNPASFIEYEFIGYEELKDITEYVELIDLENVLSYYVDKGYINKDGTLTTFDYALKIRYADGEYGDEVYRQETKSVPVKLTVRYKNLLTESTNELTISNEHNMIALEYMDDGKLYVKDSVYSIRDYNIGSEEPIYISISEERRKKNSAAYILQPGEEIVAELIYLIPECELNNAYFYTRWGGGDFRNFEAIDINFIPFTNLKKLLDK